MISMAVPTALSPAVTLGETATLETVEFTPIGVVEDSRCPIDVVCIWAGRLAVTFRIQAGRDVLFRTLELGGSDKVPGGRLEFVSAAPEKRSVGTIALGDYRFRLRLVPDQATDAS